VSRLVQAEFAAARQDDRRQQTERLVAHRMGQLDTFGLQLFDSCMHVVAHEVELVVISALSRMGSELRGRQREDQPSVTGIDRREPKVDSEELADALGVLAEDDCVNPGDRHGPGSLGRELRPGAVALEADETALAGKAVLIRTGWDERWGTER
jgi:hypothetical protein